MSSGHGLPSIIQKSYVPSEQPIKQINATVIPEPSVTK
jgi:hypothetical protein